MRFPSIRLFLCSTLVLSGTAHAAEIEFNRDIRPILSDNCFHCHGPDSASRKVGLRLDEEAAAISGDVIVPGDSLASLLMDRITTDDPDEVMPPPKTHKSISPEQAELIAKWIDQGAEWQEHWAFIPPAQIKPELKSGQEAIDHFVEERLAEKQLASSEEADRATLIRRVTLDLTGLPPTPQEVEAFVQDERPDAWDRVVNRLLESPHFGEHRARYWLDAARYADTHGLHLDNYREMWPYRDWVIEAFNENMPYDQFTVEQLAGDLLPEPTMEQQIATGFNRCNVTTSEGGAISEEFLARYAMDRINTTSTVWMGLTAECAQCHDHKFDPISQKEYFELFAFFNNTTQAGMDGNRPDTPPVISVYPDEATRAAEAELTAQIHKTNATLKKIEQEAAASFQPASTETPGEEAVGPNPLVKAYLEQQIASPWPTEIFGVLRTSVTDIRQSEVTPIHTDKALSLLLRVRTPSEPGQFVLAEALDDDGRGYRITVDTDAEGIEFAILGGEGGGELRVSQIKRIKPGAVNDVVFLYDGSGDPEGISAWVGGREMTRNRFPYVEVDRWKAHFETEAAWTLVAEPEILERLEVHDRLLSPEEVATIQKRAQVPGALAAAPDERKKDQLELLQNHYLQTNHPDYMAARAEHAELQRELGILQRSIPVTHVMQEKPEPAVAYVLERGEYDKPGEQVQPGVPAALPSLPEGAPQNRLGLAQWLVQPEHPLTARVAVNRIWQEFFGTGLVATAGDFGIQGESPSHPELLDWLAVDFMESGWDLKRLIAEIVMSDTYRRSSRVTSDQLARDPDNRLLARGPRFRLDAETLRDQALFASGLLVEDMGGPGVRPYQPSGLWETVGYENSNTVRFYQDYGDDLYRRSIYTFLKRTSPPPNMTAFDAPNREGCTIRRERTNTPLQALVLMNDVQFVEASRHLAARVYGEEDPLNAMTMHVLSRQFDADERRIARKSLAGFQEYYAQHLGDAIALLQEGDSPAPEGMNPARLAALTMVASQVLNLDETITPN